MLFKINDFNLRVKFRLRSLIVYLTDVFHVEKIIEIFFEFFKIVLFYLFQEEIITVEDEP